MIPRSLRRHSARIQGCSVIGGPRRVCAECWAPLFLPWLWLPVSPFATDVGVLTELQGKVSPLTHPLLYGAPWRRIQLTQQAEETQEKKELNAVIPSQKGLTRSLEPTHGWCVT